MKPYFSEAHADQAVNFFKKLKHTKGRWAGVPFNLQPFQEHRLRQIYGRRNADGTRQVKTVYIEEPRKNGKSEEAAGHALKLLFADGEQGAEVYGAAFTKDQAGIVYRVAKSMTLGSPILAPRATVLAAVKRIVVPKTDSFYWAIPHEAGSAQGFNTSGSVIDEYHVWKSGDLRDALKKGMGTRVNPLEFIITTAGYDRTSPCYELHQYAEQVISGAIEDPTFYAEIHAAPHDADWTDEDVWKACNPALGVFRSIEEMRIECQRAIHMPAEENNFRRYYLNQWTQQSTRWIKMDVWNAQRGSTPDESSLKNRGFYGFLDLSGVSDLTAWILLFPRKSDPEWVDVIARFWVPEARLTDPYNQYRAQYQAWHRAGLLTTASGNAIDYEFVKKQVIQDAVKFRLLRMNVDRLFQGAQLGMQLAEELGDDRVFSMGMGFASFAAPMVEFERRLLGGKINHGGNPILAWMADNVAVKTDPAGNLKPDKATPQGKIDGIVGIVGALDAQMRAEPVQESPYGKRGLLSV